jgi:hypothetical protein
VVGDGELIGWAAFQGASVTEGYGVKQSVRAVHEVRDRIY